MYHYLCIIECNATEDSMTRDFTQGNHCETVADGGIIFNTSLGTVMPCMYSSSIAGNVGNVIGLHENSRV